MNTMEDYRNFLADVRKSTGIEAFSSDDSGLLSFNVDDRYTMNLQFVEPTGKILCFIEVCQLPKEATKTVYRDLLVGGLFGKDTAGGYFALEPDSETVVYNYFFDLDKIANDVDEFVSTLEKILQLCDIWTDRIKSGDIVSGEKDASHDANHHFIAV